LDDRREARAEGGMRFQREGAIMIELMQQAIDQFQSCPNLQN